MAMVPDPNPADLPAADQMCTVSEINKTAALFNIDKCGQPIQEETRIPDSVVKPEGLKQQILPNDTVRFCGTCSIQ